MSIKAPVPPHCEKCGASRPMPICRDPAHPNHGHIWLCGSCLYKRDNPDAPPPIPMPWERRPKPLQKETLF